MKPILIDDLIKDDNTSSEEHVTIDGKILAGWQIAKPLNYDEEYFSYKDRVEMAMEVLKGKAIAVRYFCDLSEEEKVEYVKKKMNKQIDNSTLSELKN